MTTVMVLQDVLTTVMAVAYIPGMTTGRELRTERRLADITVTEVAARMGLSRQAVSVMEQRAVVAPERADQYRQALRDAIEASGRTAA